MQTVMIAEDELIVALDIKNTLISLGYKVTSIVASGEELLLKVPNEKPCLILLDISLSGKINGIECADILNKNYNIPYIFLSGYSDSEMRDKIKGLNFAGYLRKPFDKFMISKAVGEAFEKNYKECVRIN